MYIKTFFIALVLILLSGCASQNVTKAFQFSPDSKHGLVMLSTQEGEVDRHYEGTVLRSLNAAISLGLYESMDDYELHFVEFDPKNKELEGSNPFTDSDYSITHSFKTEKLAKAKKWHAIKMKPGKYIINKLKYDVYQNSSVTRFSPGSVYFEIVAGQVTYIGDILLGVNDSSRAWRRTPVVSGHSWDMKAASLELKKYSQVSVPVRKAEIKKSAYWN